MKCPACRLEHQGEYETSERYPNIITRTRFPELINTAAAKSN